jgi:hypothetical protein
LWGQAVLWGHSVLWGRRRGGGACGFLWAVALDMGGCFVASLVATPCRRAAEWHSFLQPTRARPCTNPPPPPGLRQFPPADPSAAQAVGDLLQALSGQGAITSTQLAQGLTRVRDRLADEALDSPGQR